MGPYDSETAQMTVVEELFGAPPPSVSPRTAYERGPAPAPGVARRFESGIAMRDGVELAADVHLPAESALPAPAVVKGTPYDKREPASTSTRRGSTRTPAMRSSSTTSVGAASPKASGAPSRTIRTTATTSSNGSPRRNGVRARSG
jgi:hypothetical protein